MFQVNPLLVEGSSRVHLKQQALFSSKDKSKQLKCHFLQYLFHALNVKMYGYTFRRVSLPVSILPPIFVLVNS